jgi:uncharacterized membrane protein YgaE (UPF0421/DUF939 family)
MMKPPEASSIRRVLLRVAVCLVGALIVAVALFIKGVFTPQMFAIAVIIVAIVAWAILTRLIQNAREHKI